MEKNYGYLLFGIFGIIETRYVLNKEKLMHKRSLS